MVSVSDAFGSMLKTLCLHDFPCGNGTWRKQMTVTKLPKNFGKQYITVVDKTEPQFSVTLKDYDASLEHIETLLECVSAKHSPWTFDYSWSDEARSLREIAVRSPEKINEEFIYQHFKTLRISDRNVNEVDHNLLKFTHLEYLTLCANFIQNVNSKNLPRKLLSLELCANQISELFSLCLDPPALVHLGLGKNCLTYVDDYLSGEHWPALLSLDLSFNNLTDLPETIRKLKTLPNLRNLLIMGNPVSLSPGYRGFVIDSLPCIDLLDDVRIEADERHRYRKMARLTEHELNKCYITFEVSAIRHLPMPSELHNAEEQPEFPIITRNYFVEFHYISDEAADAEAFAIHHEANLFAKPQDFMENSVAGSALMSNMTTPREDIAAVLHNDDGAVVVSERKPKGVIQSDKANWASEIELNWLKSVIREDLLAVRDFLKKPMRIDVIEETILSYPLEEEQGEHVGSAKKKKDEPKKDEKKPGKKKKEADQDMRHEPPERNILATFEASLDQFLEGQYLFSRILSKAGAQSRVPSSTPQSRRADSPSHKKDKRIKSAEKKGKGKDDKGKDERKKSGKKDGKKKDMVEVEIDPNQPQRPLEVDVLIQLHHWQSVSEVISSEP